jgi:hypothetical protein
MGVGPPSNGRAVPTPLGVWGLEHTPRWKGVGMALEDGWKAVGKV